MVDVCIVSTIAYFKSHPGSLLSFIPNSSQGPLKDLLDLLKILVFPPEQWIGSFLVILHVYSPDGHHLPLEETNGTQRRGFQISLHH